MLCNPLNARSLHNSGIRHIPTSAPPSVASHSYVVLSHFWTTMRCSSGDRGATEGIVATFEHRMHIRSHLPQLSSPVPALVWSGLPMHTPLAACPNHPWVPQTPPKLHPRESQPGATCDRPSNKQRRSAWARAGGQCFARNYTSLNSVRELLHCAHTVHTPC